MTRLNPEQRAETIGRMKPEQRAEAMYKMNPSQRAETLAKMSPQTRNSFLSKNERLTGGQKLAMGGAAMVGAGLAAHQMMQPRATVEQRSARGAEFNVPRAPGYANPRSVSRTQLESKPMISKHLGQPLKWRAGATVPRAGARGVGVGGVLDPGGYTRNAAKPPSMVTPSFAMRQFGEHFPTYAAQVAFNHQHLVANRANWPWHLPNYAPGWFGGNQGAWNWNQNWWQQPWQNWRNQQLALNAVNAQNAWWNTIAYNNANNWWNWNNGGMWNLSPWGMNSGLSWLPDLNYYDGYGYDGVNYPIDYFADEGYVPTPYVFDVAAGQFWQPGVGYSDYLPQGYNAPMTVAVQESVPSYDPQGQIVGYQLQNFYYNAFWVPQAESYGYYDYRQQFHWVTFPWMNNW